MHLKNFKLKHLANYYWVVWLTIFTILAIGIHQYFEYRIQELDQKLEQIK